jgi:hypothetical protein
MQTYDFVYNQNAGRSDNIKIADITCEKVEYLGANVMNQKSVQEEVKSRLKSEYVCYHLVQNILSSRLLSKNINLGINRT